MAETPYEQSMRVQKEFQASGSRLDKFFNKGGPSTSDIVSDSSGMKAGIEGPFTGPGAVEAAKGLTKDAGQAAAQAAPSKKGLLGMFNKVDDAGDVKGVVSDATSAAKEALPSAKDVLPNAGSPGQVAGQAKEAASKVADAAPSRGGGFFSFFNQGNKAKETAKDAAATAKDALPDSVPSPGQVASGAKDAANKAADAAPSKDDFLGGVFSNAPDAGDVKDAAKDVKDAAKDALPSSAPSPGQVASGAKDAADKVADAAPSKDNFLGGLFNNAPDASDVKDAAKDATSAAKDALPDSAPSPSQLASGAQDAADKVADAAPNNGGFLGGLFNKAPDAGDVKDAAKDASSAAQNALPDSAPSPSQVASGAKDAADKVADAAPNNGGFLGGLFGKAPDAGDVKSAAGDAASAAKDALPDSAPNPSQVASDAKDAAKSVADAAPSPGNAIDSAKQGLRDASLTPDSPSQALASAQDAADSAKQGAKDVVGSAQNEAEVVGSGDKTPSGPGFFSQLLGGAKDSAQEVKDSAQDVKGSVETAGRDAQEVIQQPKEQVAADSKPGGIFGSILKGGPEAGPADTPSNQLQAPQPSQLEEDVPKGAEKLPEQPYPEKESAVPAGSSGADSAGSKFGETVEDTKSGGGILDSFGGPPSGKSQEEKKDKLVEESKKPDPNKNFLGDLFGSTEGGSPFDGIFEGTSSAPTNEVASLAALPAPQPSDVDEKGNLPQKAPGDEIKLPEQPKPEGPTPGQSGKDSAGGKVGSTKSGGGILDFFGGSSSQPNQPTSSLENGSLEKPVSLSANSFGNPIATTAALPAPQPSDVDEKGNLPQKAPGDEIKLPEQPKPEGPTPGQVGKDSAGGKVGSTKSGGGILDFFGGSSSQPNQPTSSLENNSLEKPVSLNASNYGNVIATTAAVEAPQPSSLEEDFPESAPGNEIAPEEQPAPEPASKQLPQDSAGGETQDTKNGDGILDSFGGSTGKDSSQKAADNVNKASASLPSNEVSQIAELEGASEGVAEAVNENKPDGGKATIIGLIFSIALEIAIFTVQPKPAGKKGAH